MSRRAPRQELIKPMADLRYMGPTGRNLLNASDAATRIAAGEITSEALVADCLARIRARDPDIGAWAYVDPEYAIEQARLLDRTPRLGPLHGIPVGVKDVLDTRDMPTGYGSVIYKGNRPSGDSACVAALRRAGAVILGKTTTTEFASPWAVGVRNPQDRKSGVSGEGGRCVVLGEGGGGLGVRRGAAPRGRSDTGQNDDDRVCEPVGGWRQESA